MFGSQDEPGIMPLAVRHIFDHIANTPQREYILRVSYMEIYNEIIKDLLKPGSMVADDNLKIHQNPNGEIFVGDLEEHNITSISDVHRLISMGDGNRHIGETNMNEKSSRSHTIFRMVIESRAIVGTSATDGGVKVSLLNLVDLAGSERVSSTGAEGIRLKEGGHINKSLLALGTVIAKLSDDKDRSHIPYRDSKLTRILQSSLGGNARTGIVCTITPAGQHIDETLSTLRFANRAKNITNRPQVNEIISDDNLLKLYRMEIDDLKKRLAESEQKSIESRDQSESFASSETPSPELQSHRRSIVTPDASLVSAELEAVKRRIAEKDEENNILTKKWSELKEFYDFVCMERDSFKIALESKKRQQLQESVEEPPSKKSKSVEEPKIEPTAMILTLNAMTSAISETFIETQKAFEWNANDLKVRGLELEKKDETLQLKVEALERQACQHLIDTEEAESTKALLAEESERLRKLYESAQCENQSKIDILRTENLELTSERDALQSQLTTSLTLNQFQSGENEELKRHLDVGNNHLQRENESMAAELQTMKTANASIELQLNQKLSENEVIAAENKEMQEQYILSNTSIHDLKLAVHNMEGIIQSLTDELVLHKSKLEQVQGEANSSNMKETEAFKALQVELESIRKSQEEKLEGAETLHRQAILNLQSALAEKEQQLSELVLMLENLNGTLESARSKLDFQDGQLAQSQLELDSLKSRITMLNSELTVKSENVLALKRPCVRLIHFLASFPQLVLKFSMIEKRLFHLTDAFHNYQSSQASEMANALSSKNALQLEFSELHDKNLQLSEEFEVSRNAQFLLETRIQDMQNNLREKDDCISSFNSSIATKEDSIRCLEHKLNQEIDAGKQSQSRVIELEKETAERSTQLQQYQNELHLFTEECESLKAQLSCLEKTIEDLQSKEVVPDHSKIIIEELQEQIIVLKRQSENSITQEAAPHKFDAISKRPLTERNSDVKVAYIPKKQRTNRLKQRNEETGDCKQQ